MAFDDAGRIDCDLPCAGCGYNLRTQSPDDACPECGASIRRSIFVARLRFADPDWLRSMCYSVFWLTVGLAVLIVWPFTSIAVTSVTQDPLAWYMVNLLAPVAAVPIVWGIFQATRKEPGARRPVATFLRVLSRLCMAFGFATTLGLLALSPFLASPEYKPMPEWLAAVMGVGGMIALVVGALAGLLVAAGVAIRIRSRALTASMLVLAALFFIFAAPLALIIAYDAMQPLLWELEYFLSDLLDIDVDITGAFWPLERWMGRIGYVIVLLGLLGVGLLLMPALLWHRKKLRDAWRIVWPRVVVVRPLRRAEARRAEVARAWRAVPSRGGWPGRAGPVRPSRHCCRCGP